MKSICYLLPSGEWWKQYAEAHPGSKPPIYCRRLEPQTIE